jgi:hypothetical protein
MSVGTVPDTGRIARLAALMAEAAEVGATAGEVEALYAEAVARRAGFVVAEAARRLDVRPITVNNRLASARLYRKGDR